MLILRIRVKNCINTKNILASIKISEYSFKDDRSQITGAVSAFIEAMKWSTSQLASHIIDSSDVLLRRNRDSINLDGQETSPTYSVGCVIVF